MTAAAYAERRKLVPRRAPPMALMQAVPAAISLQTFVGTPIPLAEPDFAAAAELIGCDVAAIRAVHEVESAGRGFRKSGVPTIRFEPHVFHRETGGRFGVESYRESQRVANKSNPEKLLIEAAQQDYEAALRSTSWGLGQIMGFNHTLAGCDTPQQMVAEAKSGEAAQLLHMANFIKGARLDGHLRACDWARFARGYNGSSYRDNDYDGKLARAYARHAGSPAWAVTDLGDRGTQVKRLQEALNAAGFPCNDDGHFGPETEVALRAFQTEHGLAVDGMAGARTWEALKAAVAVEKTKETAPPPPAPEDDIFDDVIKGGTAAGALGVTFEGWLAYAAGALVLAGIATYAIRRILKK
jgi:hypothetical protein